MSRRAAVFWGCTALACIYSVLAIHLISLADEKSVLVSSRKSPAGSQAEAGVVTPAAPQDAQAPLAPVAVATDQEPRLATRPATDQNVANSNEVAGKAPSSHSQPQGTGNTPPAEPGLPGSTPDDEVSAADVETAKFNGVQPGVTTLEQLLEAWGDPSERTGEGVESYQLVYRLRPFKAVQVEIENELVQSVVLQLDKETAPPKLAQQLKLDRFRPASVRDQTGTELGIVYPERGVVFSFTPNGDEAAVSHVLLEPVTAQPFVLRAEANLHGPYQQNLRDLRLATKLDPEFAAAWWQLAAVELAIGRTTSAEQSAKRAVELDPDEASYRLRWAACLAQLAQYEEAVAQTQRVADSTAAPAHIRAQALVQLARLRPVSPAAKPTAAELYQQAIEIAGDVSTHTDTVPRRTAKRVLVDAHVGMAREIAAGEWREKEEVVPQWLDRASAFAEDMIKHEGAGPMIKLRVAVEALEALAAFPPSAGPAEWVREAQTAADALFATHDDELWHSRIHWELGQAYLHALRVEHARGKPVDALQYGQTALNHFRDGARLREASPLGEHLVGRLYFRMGAVHAIHHQSHQDAITWYEKAAPLLVRDTPRVPGADPQLHGDALVSMGVSYWEAGGRDRALELTERGTDVLRQAIEAGGLDESALAVAVGNLSNMHKLLGNQAEAERFIGIAERTQSTTRQ